MCRGVSQLSYDDILRSVGRPFGTSLRCSLTTGEGDLMKRNIKALVAGIGRNLLAVRAEPQQREFLKVEIANSECPYRCGD